MTTVEHFEPYAAGPSRSSEFAKTRDATPTRRMGLRPLISLYPYIARYRGRAMLACVSLTVAAVTTLAIPVAARRMVDFGFDPDGLSAIDGYFAAMIAVVAVLACASACRYYFVATLGERVVADVRRDVFGHLLRLSPSFFDRSSSGDLTSRLTADTTQIKAAVGASASVALRNLIMLLGAIVMMTVTSPKLSAMVLLVIPAVVIPLIACGRWVRRLSRNAQDTLADATAYASELIGAIRTVQAYNGTTIATDRFGREVDEAYEASRVSTRARAVLTQIVIFIVFSSVVVILWAGSRDVAMGAMSAGRLGQFILYAVLAATSLGQLSEVWGEVSAASGAAERLFEILRLKPEIAAPSRPLNLPLAGQGSLAFEAVSFAYPGRPDVRVLDDVAFSVRSGEKVAIVGSSGAGKSTLFHLLLRFYDPSSGLVSLDGVAVHEADPEEIRSRIALVPQDPVIFAASARDNIRFGRPSATDAEVERAADLASASGFLAVLPDGLDTRLGERGVMLSGGQRQRIAIARAILRDAPLLLLDEATSALDSESEAVVQAALQGLMKGRTTLVIAHRLATVLSCDRILVMDRGKIVEQGTHEELSSAGGLYARLARLQFGTN
ncbi:ABC transporter transmembrane domain-containing protein [Bradyrhizobium mercantei]|uniref:ABC transporter transmembrane domain-containing protein n=1 Tax=Bradyrhizobium mercantei TaxID=1904807 RepID=UPI0009762C5D|nr:ABC transporter transmembrane domain-containing protein [Bradyrhizobium mercantei]